MNLRALFDPLRRRLQAIAARGVVRLVNDAGGFQVMQVQLRAGETRTAERMQGYGFTAVPHEEAEAVVVAPGGNPEHGIVIAVDDRRYRLKGLEEGEVAMYTDEGYHIRIRRGGLIEVTGGTELRVVSPLVTMSGDLVVKGDVTDRADTGGQSMEAMRGVFNTHVHVENDNGGPTDPPSTQMGS